jgi:DNA-binding HxlR family transcriptional regulator
MRPEYLLTTGGEKLGPWCNRLMRVLQTLGLENVGLKKWSMPVALALGSGRLRFSELRSKLPDSTARALALTLKTLQSVGIVERVVLDDYPPSTYYRLTRQGRRLSTVLEGFF